jgi:outer membrane protein, multidrug efflux system
LSHGHNVTRCLQEKAVRRLAKLVFVPALLATVAGCGVLEPKLPEAEPGVPGEWPEPPTGPGGEPAATQEADARQASVAQIAWRDFFTDPRLEELISLALENNRDLRASVANVERARALYRVQRADRVPSLDVTGTMTRGGGDAAIFFNRAYSVELGVTAYELDLFGRVRNLSEAALRSYLAEEEARRSAQLSLVAEAANAYLTLLADRELKRIAEAALANRQEELELTEKRFELGAASSLEVNQAEIEVETARADVWLFAGQVAQDVNALRLLVGAPLEQDLLASRVDLHVSGLEALPPELPSEALLRRPDVLQAEYTLRAANASIGAARAAFFPSITLTGSFGTASEELSDLFTSGTDAWSFIPQINLPIFQGGRLRGNLEVTEAERTVALARYERAIQAGFREVADALALTHTLARERASRERLLAAAERADELSRIRYEAGSDSYLVLLDAQRTLYTAEQALISTVLAQQANRVTLYKALGGGWN